MLYYEIYKQLEQFDNTQNPIFNNIPRKKIDRTEKIFVKNIDSDAINEKYDDFDIKLPLVFEEEVNDIKCRQGIL